MSLTFRPLRIISDGLPELQGTTVLEKRQYFRDHLDHIRTAIIQEPRGHTDMYGAVLTPAADDADLDVFFLNSQSYSPMCGHGIIAIAKVVLETGAVVAASGTATSFEQTVLMNSPAGRIKATASCTRDATGTVIVHSTRFENVPCFVHSPAQALDVPGLGAVQTTLVWGGCFYALVDVSSVPDAALEPSNYAKLVRCAAEVKTALQKSGADLTHPTTPTISGLFGVIFVGPAQQAANHTRNVNVFEDGCIDRCPTGTGVSARATALFAKGELEIGQSITIESIIGTEMQVKVVREVEWQGRKAVVPEVTSTVFVMGESCFYLGEDDPLAAGVNIG